MDLIIDANVLFSVLIKKGKIEELIFETDIHLFAPGFIFEEFDKRTLQNSLRVIADSHFDSQLEESSSNGTSVAF